MKHFLLSFILLVIACSAFAQIHQGGWRFRNDDGSEITATWLAAQNTTPIIRSDSNGIVRLRIELYNSDPTSVNLQNAVLQDSGLFSAGQWITIPASAVTPSPFMLAGTDTNVADGDQTTPQLTTLSYVFQPGKMIVSLASLPSDSIPATTETEYEWVLKPTATILPSTTYYFRISPAQYTDFIPLPSLQTAQVLGVKLSSFNATLQGKSVKLDWSTASEQNNDHFVVQKSQDSKTWVSLATVSGSGTTTQAHSYSSFDNAPANGMNYYRIKQVDQDGRSSYSYTKSVNVFGITDVLVYPNPVRASAGINVNITGFAGKISAMLTDMSGNVVHTESLQVNAQTTGYRLNLTKQPASGIYFLHLKGEGFDKVIKVAVQ